LFDNLISAPYLNVLVLILNFKINSILFFSYRSETGPCALFLFLEFIFLRAAPLKLTEMIRQVVEPMGYQLVGVELFSRQKQGQLLRIYIDTEQGILVDDCSAVSRQVSGVLEVENPIRGDYVLEVSSPGLDRPLFELAHYQQFIGQTVCIILSEKLNGQKKFTGLLKAVEGEIINLEVDNEIICLDFAVIDRARLVVDF